MHPSKPWAEGASSGSPTSLERGLGMSSRDRTESGWYQVNRQVFELLLRPDLRTPLRNRTTGRIKIGEQGAIK